MNKTKVESVQLEKTLEFLTQRQYRVKPGGGVLVCADSADAEGVGGSKIMGNMLT